MRLSSLIVLVLLIVPSNLLAKDKSSNIITISADTYQKEVSNGVVLVDYWATWCGPCKKMEPILQDIANETTVKVKKLNVDKNKTFVRSQNINTIPTLIIYKKGIEVKRLSGVYTKQDLLEILKPLTE